MAEIINHNIKWENIDISIVFKPDYFPSVGISHLSVKAAEPLPFTSTGFKSIWIMQGELEGTSVVEYVKEALEHDSMSKKWTLYKKEKTVEDLTKTQLSLF